MVQYSIPRMSGSLYVVSTPIGNLDDITLRALETLKTVGLIAAEDTRRTGTLLRHFGVTTPTVSLHEHNERQKLPHLLGRLAAGVDIALVSDAGTPLVADPGQRLIAAAIEQGARVVPVPGASAVLAALAASGFSGDEFVFAGFVPARSNSRKRWLSRFRDEARTVILFETPHRIRKTLHEMGDLFGERPIMIAREVTKLHEELLYTSAKGSAACSIPERGEFTIVLGPLPALAGIQEPVDKQLVVDYFYQMTNILPTRRSAIAETATKFGLSTNSVYSILEDAKTSEP